MHFLNLTNYKHPAYRFDYILRVWVSQCEEIQNKCAVVPSVYVDILGHRSPPDPPFSLFLFGYLSLYPVKIVSSFRLWQRFRYK